MKKLTALAMTAICTWFLSSIEARAYPHPGGLYTAAHYNTVAAKIAANAQPWKAAYDKLILDAQNGLQEAPSALATWNVPNAYGDHAGHVVALAVMVNDAKAAYACALAYRFTGNSIYADKARDIINNWAYTNQYITGDNGPLSAAYAGVGLILAAELVRSYSGWDAAGQQQFKLWLDQVFIPRVYSNFNRNNQFDWRNFALLNAYYYKDDVTNFTRVATYLSSDETSAYNLSSVKYRIDRCIAAEGYLPEEVGRDANSLWYHYFALAPIAASAQMLYNTTGEDLFNWTSPSGKQLTKAFNYLFYYTKNPGQWPFPSSGPQNFPNPLGSTSWPLNLFEALGGVYNNASYTNVVQGYRPLQGPKNSGAYHHFAFFYPTLMRGMPQIGTKNGVWTLFSDEMDNFAAGWTAVGPQGSVTQGSGLATVTDSSAAAGSYFFIKRNNFVAPVGAFAFEVRVRSLTGATTNEMTVRSANYGVSLFLVHGVNGRAQNLESSPTKSYPLDTTVLHAYRVVVNPNYTYDLYIDGTLVWTGATGTSAGSDAFKIGGSGTLGEAAKLEIHSVRLGNGWIYP